MDYGGYISSLSIYKPISLGKTEQDFLEEIKTYGEISVYQLFKNRIKKENKISIGKPMAYKNVHKRVKRLLDLNLIEEVEGSFERGAKYYQITTFGIITLIITNHFFNKKDMIILKDNIIFKTLIFQYFEEKTIKMLTNQLEYKLNEYLQHCCRLTSNICQEFQKILNHFRNCGIERPDDKIIQAYTSYLYGNNIDKTVLKIVERYKKEIDRDRKVRVGVLERELGRKVKYIDIVGGNKKFKMDYVIIYDSSDIDFPLIKLSKKLGSEIKKFTYDILRLIAININDLQDVYTIEKELELENNIFPDKYINNYKKRDQHAELGTIETIESGKNYYSINFLELLHREELENFEDLFDDHSFVLISHDKKFKELVTIVINDIKKSESIMNLN
jgi:hypothetical protein